MSSIVVSGDTSGSVTLSAPAIANTTVLTLPSVSGTVLTSATGQTLTSPTITSPTISGAVVSAMGSSVITSGTAVASTSGTSIDFTGIPSWAKRVTVMFNGVSTSGTTAVLVQIGSGSVTTTGYTASSIGFYSPSGVNTATYTTGFGMFSDQAAANRYGQMTISLLTGTTYISSHTINSPNIVHGSFGAGGIALGGTLDRVRITTVNGTDTFDAGSINIMYE